MSDQATENIETFTHLHVHTEYSLTDGAIRIDDLLNKVTAMGHRSVAITDHANLFAAIEFYSKAKGKGLNPIIGAEIYHEPSPCLQAYLADYDPDAAQHGCNNMVLLAKNLHGYHNLVKLVSAGYLAGSNQSVPVVPQQKLAELAGDLFFIPSFYGGEFTYIQKRLLSHPEHESILIKVLEELRAHYLSITNRESCYIELCNNNLPQDQQIMERTAAWAQSVNLPLVASANAHYLNPEDQEAHLVLLSVKNDLKLPHLRNRRKNVRAHLLTADEMQFIFGAWPEALTNTLKIAAECSLKFEFGKYYLPKISADEGETAEEMLDKLAKDGLESRMRSLAPLYGPSFNEDKQNEYRKRLSYELGVINKMGFADYFLIVQDFINWAKRHDIPVGPGRGSGAGSLVAYALRITDLDPIPYNLIFERFLNPERVSMPDFDVDFCQDRRDEVIRYVCERYGDNNVAQITTFGKMLAKAALRDVGRVLDISYGKVDRIAKLIPNELGIKLKDAIAREPRLMEEANKDPMIGDLLKLALQLEGVSRHTSVHAAGIVISDGAMENYVPIYKSDTGSLITQFEMKNAEKVGLVKFDFLGLKTLTVIQRAVALVERTTGVKIDISAIPLEDKKVYQQISEAKSVGVFQLESSGMQQLLLKLKPSTFEDIIALVALFRPGPLQSGMVDDFVERKHGRQKIEYLHPDLEPILKDTYGTILYQEQVQKIAAVLASYTLGEADLLRRAMGKKKPEEMAQQKSRFVDGCVKNNIDGQLASTLFDLMAKFAEYGFNKSHSAAYGLVSYQTAYLKCHYTAQFLAASMTCDMDNTEKVVRYCKDCRDFGIKILSPDINESLLDFDVPKPGHIRFGLAAIKGIGRGSIEPIIEERMANGPFTNLTALAKRVNLNKVGRKTLELLIQAGAFDSFGFQRAMIFAQVSNLVSYSNDLHEAKARGQQGLFDDLEQHETESDQFEIPSQPLILTTAESLDWLEREKKLLGVYVSAHPLSYFSAERDKFCNARLKDLMKMPGQSDIYVMAMYYDQFERTTKDNKKMLILRIEDETDDMAPGFFEQDIPKDLPPLNTPVICKFRVLKGFENMPPRPRLEQILSLDQVRQGRTKLLEINLQLNKQDNEKLCKVSAVNKLKEALIANPGATPVRLNLVFPRAKVEMQTLPLRIAPSQQLINELTVVRQQYPNLVDIVWH